MRFCASLDFPRISGREWCILSPRSSLAPGTRHRMWRLSFWSVLHQHLRPRGSCKCGVDRNAFSRIRVCACLNMTSVVSLQASPRCMHSERSEVDFPRITPFYNVHHLAALRHIHCLATQEIGRAHV